MNVKTQINKSRFLKGWALSLVAFLLIGGNVNADVSGLNDEAMDELKVVLEQIRTALSEAPSPQPSPGGRGS